MVSGSGRPKGSNNIPKRSTLDHLRDKIAQIAQEWIEDPDPKQAREGVKVLLPYIMARKQEITGAEGGVLKIVIAQEDADL